jgi:O-antigen ligase/Tfp pilus assembly protein PilF
VTRSAALELIAIAGGMALFGYVGWDGALWDARFQLLLHVAAGAAIAGLLTLAARGRVQLPRTRLDLPILTLVAAFGVGTLFGENHGLAVRALASIVATAAMLPIAAVLLRHRPATVALVISLPVLLLSAGTLLVMLWRRAEWIVAGGPGLPPVRLANEGTPFGSVAVPPFVIMAVLPLTFLVGEPRVRRWLQIGLLAVGIPLALLSGSRSAWLAIGVSVVILLGPMLRRIRIPRRWTTRELGLAVVGVLAVGLGVVFVAPRLTAVTSLIYRGFLWRDTLDAWSHSPIFGIGPGTMPYARQAAAPPLSFPVRQPHSHNVALGVLGDAGLVGLAAFIVLLVAFVLIARPWQRHAPGARLAFAVLGGFLVASLFEDLTFLPSFNLLLMLLAAMVLLEADAVSWHALQLPGPIRLAGLAGAAALVLVMLIGDVAAVEYRLGADAAAAHQWFLSQQEFERSVALDPWHPTGPKSLAVAAEMAGDIATARAAAARAVQLNAGDGPSWTNLAILCLEQGDRGCAERAAQQAVETASLGERELANAALVFERLGDTAKADAAYRRSLLTNFQTGLALGWPRPIDVGNQILPELDRFGGELILVIGRTAMGQSIVPTDYVEPLPRALAYAIVGDRAASEAALAIAMSQDRDSTTTWDIAAVLRHHWGEPIDHILAVDRVLRGSPLATAAPTVGDLTYDIASFRMYPRDGLVSPATRLFADRPWPWSLERLLPPAS